jgi:hypothetical protein
MLTTGGLAPHALRTPTSPPRMLRAVPAGARAMLALSVLGMLLAGARLAAPAPVATSAAAPAPSTEAGSAPAPVAATASAVGAIPGLVDPVRDLTVWYSDRVADANRAALDNLRGQLLTPVDPLTDGVTRTLYGPMVLITLPLLTFGGIVLGFLIMTSRTSGEGAYAARSTTPRYIAAAVLAILGIFLASVLAQFTAALDGAMVGVALPAGSVGGPAAWPSGGGVFAVLAQAGFDPSSGQGPDNWNDGAWLSSGLLGGILLTALGMAAWVVGMLERLLVVAGPLCLAAYAVPATARVTAVWARALLVVLAVRFAWTITFVLFSLVALPHVGPLGAPPTVDDTNVLLGLAAGAAAMMLGLPLVLIPLTLAGPQVLELPEMASMLAALRYL